MDTNSDVSKTSAGKPNKAPAQNQSSSASPLQRFEKSMIIDFEKWHDGIGYDLEAIKLASPTELDAIEQMVINHSPRDWRDIEALAQINTENARETIKKAAGDSHPEIRVAVTTYAPDLVADTERTRSLVDALETAELFGGLSQVLDDVAEYHPAEVKEALIKGLLKRKGDVAVLFAALLFYINGKANEPFDMTQRPFFLRFNTEDRNERMDAFRELCEKLGLKAEKYIV